MSHYEKKVRDILGVRKKPDKSIILNYKGGMVIYGAGSTGRRVFALLKKYGVKVDYFLDIKGGAGIFIEDVPVVKPDDPKVGKASNVIIALFNYTTDVVSVLAFLKHAGFKKIIPYTELFLYFADELPQHYWLGPTALYQSDISEISKVLGMFEDQVSRDLFLSFLKFRATGDPECMPVPEVENIYFPVDIPGISKPEHFIDCGAFNGDTLMLAINKFGRLKSVRAFEPDPDNYRRLLDLNKEVFFSDDTVLVSSGVWSSAAWLNFASNGSLASGISKEGNNLIQCVALDDYLAGYKPTCIKMDIEGSELEVLKGCKKMIGSAKPNLAISVYHRPDHLWKVPLFIRELTPGYKYYLRSHGSSGYDTVFYAISGRKIK
jgi:FkbM family methyltransferase